MLAAGEAVAMAENWQTHPQVVGDKGARKRQNEGESKSRLAESTRAKEVQNSVRWRPFMSWSFG